MSLLRHTIQHWVQQYGPSGSAPPDTIIQDLLVRIESELPDIAAQDLEGYVEAHVIAYGIGVGLGTAAGGGSWGQPWPLAVACVTEYVWGWMIASWLWLRFDIHLKGFALTCPTPGDAARLALRLRLGMCDCWKLRDPTIKQPRDHNAQRRANRCLREHRLTAWNPVQMSLWNFIARAVKGDKPRGNWSGRKAFASGAFEQGMWFCDLYRDADVRFGRVLGWRCEHHPGIAFEGPCCFLCAEEGRETIFDETCTRRNATPRLFVLGPYQPEQYWRCQHCREPSYYKAYHSVCPLCQKPRLPGAARSTVWVLGAANEWEQEDEDDGDIDDFWEKLPPLVREIAWLTYKAGFSERELSQILWMSVKQVTQAIQIAGTWLAWLRNDEAVAKMAQQEVAHHLGMLLHQVEHAIQVAQRECARLLA